MQATIPELLLSVSANFSLLLNISRSAQNHEIPSSISDGSFENDFSIAWSENVRMNMLTLPKLDEEQRRAFIAMD